MRTLLAFLLALLTGASVLAAPPSVPVVGAQPAHRVQFEFHSAFLMNLHHFLFDVAANHEGKIPPGALNGTPSFDEMAALREALDFYRANYIKRDPPFDELMRDIDVGLSTKDNLRDATGLALPAGLLPVLNRAAPVYARYVWDAHDRANQLWIQQLKALDARYGAEIQAKIERNLAHPFPVTPIRCDVVAHTGEFADAYTYSEPAHSLLSSANAKSQGLMALETLYHESSHVRVTDTVVEAIETGTKALPRPPATGDLWHAIQFYTVGEAVKEVLKSRDNLDFQPYAEKNGLYRRAWPTYLPLLQTDWRMYMQGELSMQEAMRRMLEKLPPQK